MKKLAKGQCILLLTILLSVFSTISLTAQDLAKKIWSNISESSITRTGERYIFPAKYRTLHLDVKEMKKFLSTAPMELTGGIKNTRGLVFSMPMPDGRSTDFHIFETYVMHAALAEKFPEIKTFLGQGIDDPNATIRIDITPLGFHAMLLSPNGNIFIDPYCQFTVSDYICYDKRDLTANARFVCFADADEEKNIRQVASSLTGLKSSGTQLRTYRLALACTGEYAATKGGTVAGALAGMVTTMNRVNGVYETEVAIRMVMVPNDTLIIYTNSGTDPYTNSSGSTMLGQNVTTCNNIIGSANYDIGHVFSTGGGGIAGLGVVCGSSKANGVTGSPSPVGDAFDIDYVAHEMGHQFGGNHTFNSQTGSCGGGNRAASAAYEPGSGITIMAYAGICGADNLAPNSIAYFHTKNFDEIVNYSTTGNGNTCPVITSSGNTAPVITSVGASKSIPVSTPFVLTGSATDANGDPLTYSWEESDLGPAGAWNVQSTTAPMFRPFPPVTSPSRTFPKLFDIINNTTTVGELLPNQARTLKFTLTVRDNRAGGGGVMHPDSTLTIFVVNNGGAFTVTVPNTAVSWAGGSTQTVTWNVSGTTASPINCSNVNILLSTDGGNTFPTTILSNTANDGTENIIVPNITTTSARIKVEAVGNIFFDMSNTNFTITAGAGLTVINTSAIVPTNFCAGANVNVSFTVNSAANAGNVFTAQLSNASGSFASPTVIGTLASTTAGIIAATIPAGTPSGTGYRIRVVSSSPLVTGGDNGSNLTISAQVAAAGAINTAFTSFCGGLPITFTIGAIANATTYTWGVPAGAAISSGQGTTTCVIAFPSSGVTGSVTVFGSNINCAGAPSSLTVTANPVPSTPTANNVSGCTGIPITLSGSPAGGSFSVANPYNGSSATYTYTVMNGFGCTATSPSANITVHALPTVTANNVSGCAGTSINLSGSPAGGSYSVANPYTGSSTTYTHSFTDANGCSNTSASATITVNPLPAVSFSGLASSYNSTDAAVTLTGSPSGGTFSGPGISGNTFNPSSAGVGGPYSITYSFTNGNSCTNSSAQQTSVINCTTPVQPGTISEVGGTTKVCPGDSRTYKINLVSGATSYLWTPPAGSVIATGQGTKTVTLNYLAGFTSSGTLSVVAINSCGNSVPRNKNITRNTPAKPSIITGQNTGLCLLTGVPFTVLNVSGITYNWSFNIGGASVSGGQGTNAITADFNSNFSSGTLSVTAGNGCGISAARTLAVKSVTANPGTITGATGVCVNQAGVPYSVLPVSGAVSYTWSGPSGSRFTDGVTTSTTATFTTPSNAVAVNFKTTAGNIKVKTNAACGSSNTKSLNVTFVCRDGISYTQNDMNLSVYPNPASSVLAIHFISTAQDKYSMRLTDQIGKTVSSESGSSVPGENTLYLDLSALIKGIYALEVKNGNRIQYKKIVVN